MAHPVGTDVTDETPIMRTNSKQSKKEKKPSQWFYVHADLFPCRSVSRLCRSVRGGFTLVELLVAMGIFIVVLGIVTSIFLGALRTQRAMVALMAANDNASLALEQMAREIRTGTSFPAAGTMNQLQFVNANGKTVLYQRIVTAQGIWVVERSESGVLSAPITGENVDITRLVFTITQQNLLWPPRITISLGVGFADPRLQSITNDLQTTISAREI